MELKVSKSQCAYLLLGLCLLLQNCFFHIINPSSTITLMLLMGITLLFLIAISSKLYGAGKYLKQYIVAVFAIVIIPQSIYAFTLGESVSGYIDVIRGPYCLLLALPVVYIMLRRQGMESVLNMIAVLTTITLTILLANSFFLNNFETSLLPFDYFQKPETKRGEWYRLFLISDFLSFTAIYSFSRIVKSKGKKGWFVFAFLVCFVSEIYVEQSRMIVMAIAASCIVIFAQSMKRNRVWFYLAAALFIAIGLFGDWFAEWFEIFSVDNEGYGISTKIRINEVRYALKLIAEHPFMGTGMVADYLFRVVQDGFLFEYNHTDIGLLGSITYIGLLGTIVLYIAPYCRFVRTLRMYQKEQNNTFEYSFMLGLIVFLTVTSFTILITDNARIFAWPFICAVFEYCRYTLKRREVANELQ